MIIHFHTNSGTFSANLNQPLDISLPLKEGEKNPNCYRAGPVKVETIVAGSFIGSVKDGGPVNYQKLTVTPHGNGTHTECYGHISDDGATINDCLHRFHFIAELISVTPSRNSERDCVITRSMIEEKLSFPIAQALIVRTLPNEQTKITRQYSGNNPPYFEVDAIRSIVSHGIVHLLTDLPSLDKEQDEGRLLSHRCFWKFPEATRRHSTVTELLFADSSIADGLYLLNLQIASLEMDASPSKPVLYKLEEVS